MTHEWETITEENLLEFWKRQLTTHAEKRLAQYFTRLKDGTETYKTLTYEQFDRITTNLACEWKPMLKDNTYIGYINNHSIDYLITYISILKMNSILVCLSTRNSAAVNARLLQSVDTTTLLAASSHSTMAYDTSAILGNSKVIILDPYDIDAMVETPLNPNAEEMLKETTRRDSKETTLVLHSSGSTGTPKIVCMNSQTILYFGSIVSVIDKECGANVLGDKPNTYLYCSALFHISGHFNITDVALTGSSVVFMEPGSYSIEIMIKTIKDIGCDIASVSPSVLIHFFHYLNENDNWSELQSLRSIVHGSASIKREIAEKYREKHINICSIYGGTEMGVPMTESMELDSPYKYHLRPLSKMKQYCLWEDYALDPRLKQLIIRHDCPTLSNSAKRREDGNYETNDLFLEDELNPGHYTYVSRTEDTLVLNTASKVNPLPIEATITECPIINECLIFGMGYPCIGVLVELSEDAHLKYSVDEIQNIEQYTDTIDALYERSAIY
ncbi:hypothetical protein BDF14DRAFT_1959219 [Spinellus fusiger]|nr:hypothetical protein BDF14DRAFT_1959219 [Spinellus fusiger]